MTLKRITRDRRLTPEEGAKYRDVRQQIAKELPELLARQDERFTIREPVNEFHLERERRGSSEDG